MEAAFDAYFCAADLDRDRRIRGQEVVAFFKGSGLPQPVLAQAPADADLDPFIPEFRKRRRNEVLACGAGFSLGALTFFAVVRRFG